MRFCRQRPNGSSRRHPKSRISSFQVTLLESVEVVMADTRDVSTLHKAFAGSYNDICGDRLLVAVSSPRPKINVTNNIAL